MRVHAGAGAVLLLALFACKHDLDKLSAGRTSPVRDAGPSGSGAGGNGGGQSGSGGADDDAGSEGGTGGSQPPANDCQPCPELSASATQLELRSCCRGVDGDDCGLTFAAGMLCLQGSVPGQPDPACNDVNARGMQLPGCCRPDGRCGVDAADTGLGCVAREVVSEFLGAGSVSPVPCRYECENDADCNALPGGFVCAQDVSSGERFCANDCLRNQDCPRELDQVCAFSNDLEMNRVLAICRPAVGPVEPGAACEFAEDCVNGVCLEVANVEPYCTEFCRTSADCPADRRTCIRSNIDRPDGGTQQMFSICRR